MDNQRTVVVSEQVQIELRMPEALAASALRAFLGSTPIDTEVDSLSIPEKPFWLRVCVRLLRAYRRRRPQSIEHRCVYDPSCSRYSELALRKHGLIKGGVLTVRRLQRCRPGLGGVDVP